MNNKSIQIPTIIILLVFAFLIYNGTDCGDNGSTNIIYNETDCGDNGYTEVSSSSKFRVAGWLPTSWDGVNALETFMDNLNVIDEISPVWYDLMEDGSLSSEPYGGRAGNAPDPWIVDKAHENDIIVIPCIGNTFDPVRTNLVLNNSSLKSQHIRDILDEVILNNYDGIDIDYENCSAVDRDAFSLFIEELADALHAHEKILSVCVHAKTISPGTWWGDMAQDWERLGKAVDRFRIMTYDHHYSLGAPGPIAPAAWVEKVIDFALTLVEPSKVFQGIPFYAYDWPEDGEGLALSWLEIQEIISDISPSIIWDEEYKTPWFKYEKDSTPHEVWYEDARSIEAKVKIAAGKGIGGIAIWRLGSEDPENWSVIRRAKRE